MLIYCLDSLGLFVLKLETPKSKQLKEKIDNCYFVIMLLSC